LPNQPAPGYGGFPPREERPAGRTHKEASMKKKGKAKKRGKAKDLSVRKGGKVKGGTLSAASMRA
jgi:hypothetical protein